jgi:hypothetical protein
MYIKENLGVILCGLFIFICCALIFGMCSSMYTSCEEQKEEVRQYNKSAENCVDRLTSTQKAWLIECTSKRSYAECRNDAFALYCRDE